MSSSNVLALVTSRGGVAYIEVPQYRYDGLADLLGRVSITGHVVEYNPHAATGAELFRITTRETVARVLGVIDVIEEVNIAEVAAEYDRRLAEIKEEKRADPRQKMN